MWLSLVFLLSVIVNGILENLGKELRGFRQGDTM